MKLMYARGAGSVFTGLSLLVMPVIADAQPEKAKPGPPPISQQLVREGDFAIKLQTALGLGTTEDEAEAESALGEVGIVPRNGWIADYPVTPDIVGELQKSVGDAANARKIGVGKDEALKRFSEVSSGFNLGVRSHTAVTSYETVPEESEKYPNPTVINNYYTTEGPPVVTYYAPPPDYYYLYGWVPYPFWWAGFWFPGYFILNDFYRPILLERRVVFVSNHFNDIRANRVFRIDPVSRFRGRTYAGIGVSGRRGFISTGVSRSERRIFNSPRNGRMPSSRSFSRPSLGSPGGGRMTAPGRGDRGFPARGERR